MKTPEEYATKLRALVDEFNTTAREAAEEASITISVSAQDLATGIKRPDRTAQLSVLSLYTEAEL